MSVANPTVKELLTLQTAQNKAELAALADLKTGQENIRKAIDAIAAGSVATPPGTTFPPSLLPSFKGVTLRLYGWGDPWTSGTWDSSQMGYTYDIHNIVIDENGVAKLSITETPKNAAMLMAGTQYTKAKWEIDTTWAPRMPGLIQAQLWTYAGQDAVDELDFEMVGTAGLWCTIHSKAGGGQVWTKQVPDALIKARNTLGIKYLAGVETVFSVDGKDVFTVKAADLPGKFPTAPQNAFSEIRPVPNAWNNGGVWQPLAVNGRVDSFVHGFRLTQL